MTDLTSTEAALLSSLPVVFYIRERFVAGRLGAAEILDESEQVIGLLGSRRQALFGLVRKGLAESEIVTSANSGADNLVIFQLIN